MVANLQNMFLKAFGIATLVFAGLCLAKRFTGAVPGKAGAALCALRGALCYGFFQLLQNLTFFAAYAFYVKQGVELSFSDLGVACTAVSVVAFFLLWRLGGLDKSPLSLIPAAVYSGFLVYKFAAAPSGLGFFGYLLYNPMFGFIGNALQGTKRLLAVCSALLPFACAALGRGLAVKRIDKGAKLWHN